MNTKISFSRCWVRAVIAGLLWMVASGPLAGQPKPVFTPSLTLLDGGSAPLQSLSISKGKLIGPGLPAGLTLDDLRRISLAAPGERSAAKPAMIVQLVGGGRVLGKGVRVAANECVIDWDAGAPLKIPIDKVRWVRLDTMAPNAEFDKAVAAPAAENDRIFLKVEKQVDSVAALLDSLTEQEVAFKLEGQIRKAPREKLYGLVIAQPQGADDPTRCLLSLQDGSTLAGDIESVENGVVSLLLPGDAKLELPWAAVQSVAIHSHRLTFLSDLNPLEEEQKSIAFVNVPWRRNRSVLGRPLTLAGQVYERGIGVHAYCKLTFDAGGKFDIFAATIGLDAETLDKGDCIFSVLGDGEVLLTQRMQGGEAPRELQLSIPRIKQLTLLVEPGEGLDLADHADWCDARLIRAAK